MREVQAGAYTGVKNAPRSLILKTFLLAGTAATLLAGCATTKTSEAVAEAEPAAASAPVEQAAVTVPDNVLLTKWTGPYAGVPP